MNDSLSVSSSYSSSNNSNSNSLNRSTLANGQALFARGSRISAGIDDYLQLQMTPIKRRSKSQIIYYGDETNTIAEHNKQLVEDLYLLKKQLKEKDDTIKKLNENRDKLENEIQDLSASLFEQAYLMVNTAKAETVQAEKLLKEANGKIDVLQAEVKALKELVITSTPSTPNKHLHIQLHNSNHDKVHQSHSRKSSLTQQQIINTQIQQNLNNLTVNQYANGNVHLLNTSNNSGNHLYPPTLTSTPSSNSNSNNLTTNGNNVLFANSSNPNLKHSSSAHNQLSILLKEKSSSLFSKTHKRVPSHNDVPVQPKSLVDKIFQAGSSNSLPNSNGKRQSIQENLNYSQNNHNYDENLKTIDIVEFDPIYFRELAEWKENPILNFKELKCQFINRVYEEDILPCLKFPNKKISEELLSSIESNSVCVEELNNAQLQSLDTFAQICAFSNIPSLCQYKIKLSENSEWLLISKLSRNRVISVCDFYTYLRYIKDGLVKCDIREIYWNIIELRKKMSLSRLGF